MNPVQQLKDQLSQFSASLLDTGPSQAAGSTLSRLVALAGMDVWDGQAADELGFFSKKYDISGKLFASYDAQGRKNGEARLGEAGLQLFAGLLYLRVLNSIDQNASGIDRAKYVNVCWKIFGTVELPDFLDGARDTLAQLQSDLFDGLPDPDLNDKARQPNSVRDIPAVDWDGFRTLPVDVLFYEGPIARAYLEVLYSLRCKPRKIVHLIAANDIVTKKKVGSLLPSFLRSKYAAAVQSRKIHHWPQFLRRSQKGLIDAVFARLGEALNIEQGTLSGACDLKPLDHYCDDVVPLPITSLKDAGLSDYIKAQGAWTYLFTGGGIVPQSLFDIPGVQYLHIHPGYLPDIRGADCLLWSTLLAGRPSATCFFMNAGIDTGDVINAAFLPDVTLPSAAADLDQKMVYRLVYGFVDPWVRAVVLRDTLTATGFLENLSSVPQKMEDGTTFHFMHDTLSADVIARRLIAV